MIITENNTNITKGRLKTVGFYETTCVCVFSETICMYYKTILVLLRGVRGVVQALEILYEYLKTREPCAMH